MENLYSAMKPVYILKSVFLPPKPTTPWEFPQTGRITFAFLKKALGTCSYKTCQGTRCHMPLDSIGDSVSAGPPSSCPGGVHGYLLTSAQCVQSSLPTGCLSPWDHWWFTEILVFWEGRTKINLAVGKSSMLFWISIRTWTLSPLQPSFTAVLYHLPSPKYWPTDPQGMREEKGRTYCSKEWWGWSHHALCYSSHWAKQENQVKSKESKAKPQLTCRAWRMQGAFSASSLAVHCALKLLYTVARIHVKGQLEFISFSLDSHLSRKTQSFVE